MKEGKRSKQWKRTRRQWISNNPPGFRDEYICGICKRWVHKKGMELDHILPKSSYPELAFKLDNLQPTHQYCNQSKGSKHENRPRR